MAESWWRRAVLYEIYVRSFADANGDGVGDLQGIRSRLGYVRELGVDGIWLTPFYPSPGADHGYDVSDYRDVDPAFGTLADFDELVADAHELGLRVLVDVVPNHTSSAHPWFLNALSRPDHPDRARYVFAPARDGGPPNNWPSTFGGPAWTRDEPSGEYYLHLFAPEQPDLDWHNAEVRRDFEEILRFWLERGVDGFRIDVAHALFKDPALADEEEPFPETPFSSDWRASIDRPEVHPLYRRWRRLVEGYDGERILVGEVSFSDPDRIAAYVRPDELHLAFNVGLLLAPWEAVAIRQAIEGTRAALAPVGATPTWVLESHDVMRVVTRYGGGDAGRRRARAACLLVLALPGTVFLYAGEELGLEEADLADEVRQDPIFFRTRGEKKGRDGCRVPIPWASGPPGYGFSTATPWLPIDGAWAVSCVETQQEDVDSMLRLHARALALRRELGPLRAGEFAWLASPPGTVAFTRALGDEIIVCAVNLSDRALPPPAGELVLASAALGEQQVLPPDSAAWLRTTDRPSSWSAA